MQPPASAIRSGDFKLMGDQLFDIIRDPSETTNVAAQHPELVQRLSQRFNAMLARLHILNGAFDKAIPLFRRALAISRASYGERSAEGCSAKAQGVQAIRMKYMLLTLPRRPAGS